jgi:NAD(P)-dependent dehydrogenase (short-subunit alcohol dehydrogenase family)
MFNFAGKTVLVTGGTGGIGRAVANAFVTAGASVIAAGLPASDPIPAGATVEYVDASDDSAVRTLFESIGGLDILVNAAGMIQRDEEFDIEVFTRVLDVNLTGTMRFCMAAHPHLRQSNGCVVNVASMLSFFGGARVPAYSASKGGVAQLTRSLALAWAQDGIRVNAVAPGWIATTLTQALQDDPVRSAPLLARTPFGRWGRPEEIAGPVLFLCSESASFMTGAVVPVDGGYSAA